MSQTTIPDPEEQALIDSISEPGPGVEVLHPINPLDDLAEAPDPDPDEPGPGPDHEDPLPPAATKPDTRDRILGGVEDPLTALKNAQNLLNERLAAYK